MAVVVLASVVNAAEDNLSVTPNMSPDASYAVKSLDYSQITAIETTANGRLWASLLGGGDDANGFLTLTYSDKQGKSWVEPVLALDARTNNHAVRNGVLWLSPKGELWLFYTIFDGYYDGRGSMWAMVCKNPDDMKPMWETPQYIGVGVATGRPILNNKGEWLLPMALWGRVVIGYDKALTINNRWATPRYASPYVDKYKELDSKRGAGVYISADEGASWNGVLGNVLCSSEVVKGRYNNPQLFLHEDGAVRMVLRTSGTAWTYAASSWDGVSWRSPSKFVAAPDQNFALHRLADGRLLMVRNGRFDRHIYWSPEGMYAYLSDDSGATWYGGLRVSTEHGCINPVVAESKDGTIYIATHTDPEGKCVNTLVTTSAVEIDAATANYENTPKVKQVVLTAAKVATRVAAETKVLTAPKKSWASEDLRVATYNIQYPTKDWSEKRMPALIPLLDEYKFDLFGAQEPFMTQIEDMMAYIGKDYAWIGTCIAGDDKVRNRHFNPIFYRVERLELLEYDTVWLSDEVAVPGYGAWSARLFTWAKFRDKKTDKVFYFFNGHYDHRGVEARINSSYIVLDMVKRIAKGMPAFVTADYNSDESSTPYHILQNSLFLKDTMLAVSEPTNAQYQSHGGYRPVENKPANGKHIDHIFYTPNAIRIRQWELIIKGYGGYYGSDHLPIYVDCRIGN